MALRDLGGDLLYIRRRIFCTKKRKKKTAVRCLSGWPATPPLLLPCGWANRLHRLHRRETHRSQPAQQTDTV